jgi:hypothetical protein
MTIRKQLVDAEYFCLITLMPFVAFFISILHISIFMCLLYFKAPFVYLFLLVFFFLIFEISVRFFEIALLIFSLSLLDAYSDYENLSIFPYQHKIEKLSIIQTLMDSSFHKRLPNLYHDSTFSSIREAKNEVVDPLR